MLACGGSNKRHISVPSISMSSSDARKYCSAVQRTGEDYHSPAPGHPSRVGSSLGWLGPGGCAGGAPVC